MEETVVGYVDLTLRFRREIRLLFEDIAEMSCHQDLNVIEWADGLLDALAGRSRQAPARGRRGRAGRRLHHQCHR
ncbi:hypothetical protein SHIRM173S_11901 [Streptomyces hirsutus]